MLLRCGRPALVFGILRNNGILDNLIGTRKGNGISGTLIGILSQIRGPNHLDAVRRGPKGQKGQKGHGKGKTKGKQKSQLSQAEEELQFGPTALGVKLPAPPWTPPVSGATSSAGNATNTATPMDSQLRGFLNEMKKVVDLPADGHAIIQKYQKK